MFDYKSSENPVQTDKGTSQMHQSLEYDSRTFVAHRQAPEVLQPRIGALDNPTMLVAPQFASILTGCFAVVLAGGNNWLHAALHQLLPHRVAVIALVSNQAFWLSLQARL